MVSPSARLFRLTWVRLCLIAGIPFGCDRDAADSSHHTDVGVESSPSAALDAPNQPSLDAALLIVTLDTVRRDALGFAGGDFTPAVHTPVLDELAKQSVEFTHTWTVAPVTLPAHASLFTGLYPTAHGVHDNLGFRLPDSANTLAEQLAERGFATAAVVAAPVVGASSGLAQGFQTFDGPTEPQLERPAGAVTTAAVAALAQLATTQQPFFLWAHYFDAHAPHAAPPVGSAPGTFASTADERAAYRDEIERIDRQLGRLLAAARAAAGTRPLCIVVVADHGEALGDHREATHGHLLHDATLRIPLLIHHPRFVPGRCSRTSSLVDLLPTLQELFELPDSGASQGLSLLPWLQVDRDRAATTDRIVCFESRLPWHEFGWPWLDGASDGRFKWIDRPRPVLYDLASDPLESVDCTEAQRDRMEALTTALHQLERSAVVDEASVPRSADAAALTSLGYVAARRATPPDPTTLTEPEDRLALVELRDRGLLALEQHGFAAALAAFEELQRRNSDPAPGSLLIAVTRSRDAESRPDGAERQAALEAAATAWQAAIALCPDDALRRFNLAMTLLDLGRRDDAIRELERCVELAPDYSRARDELAAARAEAGPRPPR